MFWEILIWKICCRRMMADCKFHWTYFVCLAFMNIMFWSTDKGVNLTISTFSNYRDWNPLFMSSDLRPYTRNIYCLQGILLRWKCSWIPRVGVTALWLWHNPTVVTRDCNSTMLGYGIRWRKNSSPRRSATVWVFNSIINDGSILSVFTSDW